MDGAHHAQRRRQSEDLARKLRAFVENVAEAILDDPTKFLTGLFEAAVAAAQPSLRVPGHLPEPPKGRTIVIGGGKAGGAMAAAVEAHYKAEVSGLVITRYDYAAPTEKIEIIEAAHPVPDAAGMAAAERMLEMVSGLSEDDLVLCLISGGGSALMALPADGISLEEKQSVGQTLLRSGATINEINVVRKHLSKIKGGRLARASAPARLVTLVISDVVGDDLSAIASGPTVPDPSSYADALAVVLKYDLQLPSSAMRVLEAGGDETPKPGDVIFDGNEIAIIASGSNSLEAAAKFAKAAGITPIILDDSLEGEARQVGRAMAELVEKYRDQAPCVLLSGGELTVTVKGAGKGGPNTEFLMGLASGLKGAAGVYALACDTDGADGLVDNAGAMITPDTLERAEQKGLDFGALLADNDAYSFFAALGDLVVSGPTHTNVNDFRAILIEP
ncbi:MAG: glycerate kinase [Rhodospirillaceae bacterium]|jgi:glycerate 2-kinase|nr:glycerate kinase [Rhodospirillaceae bacterium]MBT4589366.1 glycerate kinase [Rhodospirillaceae bacterium]MBT4939944.1 glycerate kinase [Rhodospirillaceae bacterium]MBT7265451.1 glycerate kinase [Rhodospirillaceae bacterium]